MQSGYFWVQLNERGNGSVLERAIHRGRAFIGLYFAMNRVLQPLRSLNHTRYFLLPRKERERE